MYLYTDFMDTRYLYNTVLLPINLMKLTHSL